MITLHIEAETFDELRDKALRAIGTVVTQSRSAEVGSTGEGIQSVLHEAEVAEQVKHTRRTKAEMEAARAPEIVREISKLPLGQQQAAIDAALLDTDPSGNQAAQMDDGSDAGQTAQQTVIEGEVVYDYQTDIKPRVLEISQKFSRPGVEKLLSTYGVTNASQIPSAKYPQLLREIEDALNDETYV